jgi:hypothetical protein
MVREIVWVESSNFRGWGCSGCAWVFHPSGALAGNTIEEMKQKYEHERDKEFASHICVTHPRFESPKKK